MAEKNGYEELMKVTLSSGDVIQLRFSISSTFVVGPGPRPKKDEWMLASRIDDKRLLFVGCKFMGPSPKGAGTTKGASIKKATGALRKASIAAKSIRVGPGGRVGGG